MTDLKTAIVPLKGDNYATWKVQCRMALIKDGYWDIVKRTETAPTNADARQKFLTRRGKALALIGLTVDPSLLYLIGTEDDPCAVWEKLEGQFQRKTWANKLRLRKKLVTLKLKEGGSVSAHIKEMTETFEALSVMEAPVSEDDRVVYLLASLPESYNMVVTALETQSEEVPKWALVTERLLHQEAKLKERLAPDGEAKRALTANGQSRRRKPKATFKCHFCGNPGHYKRDCRKFLATRGQGKQSANSAEEEQRGELLVTTHALTTMAEGTWIVDSGATAHMCNNPNLFTDLKKLEPPLKITLGDGRCLDGTGEGTVIVETLLPDGSTTNCKLKNTVLVPGLSYSLLSVSKASTAGKTTKFDKTGCEILNGQDKVIAFATRVGNLYHLEYCHKTQSASVANSANKEKLWHRRYGHLGEQNLKQLARDNLVEHFDYNSKNTIGFCETCVGGKHHRSPFTSSTTKTSTPLELVHSDVCGRMQNKSAGGAEYFLTLTDDHTRYSWVYMLKTKDQVFEYFQEWKALVEKQSKYKLKTLRTDNGGEYTSKRFEQYLKAEGIRHEKTIPKTPEQNGVSERLNRTLVEGARSMLLDAKLAKSYWAEAVNTAVYLKNRCPTKAVKGKTPYEAWYGKKPNVEHLRVFGCTAYAHVPKDERGKFDSKARKCVLLGYDELIKGYRLLEVKSKRILHCRDVRFHEQPDEPEDTPTDSRDTDIMILNDGEEQTEKDEQSDCERPTQVDVETVEPRRTTRIRQPPNYYGVEQTHLTADEPTTLKDIDKSNEKRKWRLAMKAELNSLAQNDVWDLVPLPPGKKTVGSKWVFKKKTGADGKVERFKARLVAQGFTQRYGDDYDETFCPVVRFESLRAVLALAVKNGLKLHQVDVTTAFLNGSLEEEVYMKQPEGFIEPGSENLVCRLKKSIYGLKQSPRCWNLALDSKLKEIGLSQSSHDPCIYYKNEKGNMLVVCVYVDDIILAGQQEGSIQQVKVALASAFDIKDLGRLNYFLGIKIEQKSDNSIWIGQPAYIEKLLTTHGMQNCKPVNTPVSIGNKLVKANEEDEPVNQRQYQSAVGSLMYLAVSTRPDISYAVSSLARFSCKPTNEHWTALKRLLRYLKGTTNLGILYSNTGMDKCIGYTDADWAGDQDDRKSTSGYIFLLCGGAISWKSQKQKCVALSTAEAEYIAMSTATQEAIWLRQLIAEVSNSSKSPTLMFEDNQSAIAMARNPQFHGRAKHIEIKHHYVREQLSKGTVTLQYCPSHDMVADILTKGLGNASFSKLRRKSGVMDNV